jgi:E3 ubiquitin-protein ligase UBR7
MTEAENGDDAASEASSSGLPPPLITGDEYESFICGICALRNPTVKRWMGTAGTIIVARETPDGPWLRIEGPSKAGEELIEIDSLGQDEPKPGDKRPVSPSALDGPEAKRAKGASHTVPSPSASCLAPPQHPLAKSTLSALEGTDKDSLLGTGDIFFTLGFRERWCHCASVSYLTFINLGIFSLFRLMPFL